MRTYNIATAPKKNSYHWEQLPPMSWAELVAWLDLDHPADRKECGGYVLGELRETTALHEGNDHDCTNLHRSKQALVSRSVVALDADYADASFPLDSGVALGCALAIYTTWRHTPGEPRFRLLVPLSRDVSPTEYRLIADALVDDLGREQFDPGSLQPERYMFKPSTQGSDYESHDIDGDPLDAEAWLTRAKELELDQKATSQAITAPYDGPNYDELPPGQQAMATSHLQRSIDQWRAKLAEAAEWDENGEDERGRRWELLARDSAWALARLAVTPWVGWDEMGAAECYAEILPGEMAANEICGNKWDDGIVARAAASSQPLDQPPWVVSDFDQDNEDADADAGRAGYVVDVTNEADALDWVKAEVGRGRLSGVFRRGQELVHTPRIGEHGYVEPKTGGDHNGPAQVRRIQALELATRIDHNYSVVRRNKSGPVSHLFPQVVAARASTATDLLTNARDLSGVTHTPAVRRDGSILDVAGYDDASGMLYLPDADLTVPQVAESPSAADVQKAGRMLLDVVADFPFITQHDRANYLGALLTPLLRPVVPPPYKLLAIGAPQRGSGKTLLAWIMREVHGGVFKSEMPADDGELRKFITSTLEATTGPVVQFDNVTGVLKSSTLDGLLTSAEWSDRPLGRTDVVTLPNDRLWVVTGNNVAIGGDLERRTLWVTINANMERPEERTSFTIPNLESWVRAHRGELLWALLTLIRAWVVADRPTPPQATTDSFGQWVAVLRGILSNAELGDTVGEVGHAESALGRADPEDEEWAVFLRAAYRVFGSDRWTAKELLERTEDGDFHKASESGGVLLSDELPGDLLQKFQHAHLNRATVAKSLGRWLKHRDGRWAEGLKVEEDGDRRGSKLWRIDTNDLDDLI
jgi:hypothetical protein